MKKVLFAILLIFALCSVSTAEIKDSPDGFRGIKWGQSPDALGKNCSLVMNEGKLRVYLENDDKLRIGDAEITSVMYGFWDNKFMSVVIKAEGLSNSKALKAEMIARHGEPHSQPDKAEENYRWYDDNAVITYTYYVSEVCAGVGIASAPLIQAQLDEEREAAQKGVKNF